MRENVELFVAQSVFLRVNLDASALVAHVNEHGFAHVAVRGDAASDGNLGVFSQFAALKFRARVARADAGRKFVLERENAFGFK